MNPKGDQETLHLYLPRLPRFEARGSEASWPEELLWQNCGARLLELGASGNAERSLLETCTMQKDGRSYRLQIQKGHFFSDGSEITAREVVASLLAMSRDPQHPSQLHQLLLEKGSAQSFKFHTRYRFEIFLREPASDLLDRLAFSAAFIRKGSDLSVSSGDWMVSRASPEGLILKPNPFRPKTAAYHTIEIKTLATAPQSLSSQSPATLALFPGTLRKAGVSNALSETSTLALRPQLLFGFWLEERALKGTARLRRALQDFASQRSTWRQARLSHLFGAHAFGCELLLSESKNTPDEGRASWTLSYDPSLIDPTFLDDLSAFVRHRWKIELHFTTSPSQAVDARLLAFYDDEAVASFFTQERLLAQLDASFFKSEALQQLLAKAQADVRSPRRRHLLREFLQKLAAQPQFLPFASSPLLAFSNRVLQSAPQQLGTLLFSQVGKNIFQQRGDELRHAHLNALGSAVQMLAHDIKKPFGMLETLLSLLLATDDPARILSLAKTYAPHIRLMTRSVQQMITDILELGSDQELLSEPISPRLALLDSLNFLPLLTKGRALRYDWQHQLTIEGDRYKLSRIFSNLISNALQAMPENGTLTIGSRQIDEETRGEGGTTWIELWVHNTGSYISPEKRQLIFDAFYTEGKDEGTGLGLAIVKKFVLAHEGHLRCESDRATGTRFVITLPASYKPDSTAVELPESWLGPAPLPSPDDRALDREPERLRILMIDDDILDIQYLDDVLAQLGKTTFDLVAESSLQGGLQRAETETFDWILLDYQLGSDDGLELLPRFRKLLPRAKLALHSHRAEPSLQQAALTKGADFFLPKPLERDFLESLFELHEGGPSLILVEDDPIYAELWHDLSPYPVKTFRSPLELRTALSATPSLAATSLALISDGSFARGLDEGVNLLRELEEKYPSLPLYLCSHLEDADYRKSRIKKDPEAIEAFLQSLAAQSGHM